MAVKYCGNDASQCKDSLTVSASVIPYAEKKTETALNDCKPFGETCTKTVSDLLDALKSSSSLLSKASSDCESNSSSCISDVKAANDKVDSLWARL